MQGQTQPMELEVNGEVSTLEVPPGELLLWTLRDRLQITSVKPACERGECGACMVRIGDELRVSCITPTALVDGPVFTAEGVTSELPELCVSFARHGAFQCGYCTPGQIVAAAAVCADDQPLTEDEVRHLMSGSICRCTGYTPIADAISAVRKSEIT